jgi:aminoglycoside phosphotransferase (APT) family kinase protein
LFDPLQRRISGVIDFSDVVITDPLLDVMYLYASYGREFLEPFLSYYAEGDPGRMEARVRALYAWYTAIRLLWALEHDYAAGITLRLDELRALQVEKT